MKQQDLGHLVALLHDIGKFRIRATNHTNPYQEYCYEFATKYFAITGKLYDTKLERW